MASQSNVISGIDIESTYICYAQCLTEDRVIANVTVQPIEDDSGSYWDDVDASLNKFIPDLKIQGEQVVLSLPGEYAIIKKVFVENDETDIKEVIEWELGQQIIGTLEDMYVYDYEPLKHEVDEETTPYLVVGYKETAIQQTNKLLRSKKLNPVIIDLDIFALINVFEANYGEKVLEPAVIIFADTKKTKLILTTKGSFIDVEVFEHANEDQTFEEYNIVLIENLKKFLSYNTDIVGSGEIQSYMTGASFMQQEMVDIVTGSLSGSEILNPFKEISCSGVDNEKLKKFLPMLSVSVGLALRNIE